MEGKARSPGASCRAAWEGDKRETAGKEEGAEFSILAPETKPPLGPRLHQHQSSPFKPQCDEPHGSNSMGDGRGGGRQLREHLPSSAHEIRAGWGKSHHLPRVHPSTPESSLWASLVPGVGVGTACKRHGEWGWGLRVPEVGSICQFVQWGGACECAERRGLRRATGWRGPHEHVQRTSIAVNCGVRVRSVLGGATSRSSLILLQVPGG